MNMTVSEITKGLTPNEYSRLLTRLAETIHTQRKFITIERAERINSVTNRYMVKRQSVYYLYVIEEIRTPTGKVYFNLGFLI